MTNLISKIFKKSPRVIILGLFFIGISQFTFAQKPFIASSDSLDTFKHKFVKGATIGGTSIAITSLGYLWYSDYDIVPFHFFDDSKEWLLMDKIGHGTSAYYGGYFGYNALKWAGVSERKSAIYGGMYGWSFLIGTEILDGFSDGWGASPSDLLANSIGTSLFISQQLLWKEQRIKLKFSYWPSKFAEYRPELLGYSHWDRWLKDYNGQIYWASMNLNSMGLKYTWIPEWLNISFGYSGDGMLGGVDNPEFNNAGEVLPYFKRESEFYFSLDVDWERIPTRNPYLKTILKTASFIKIPFPAIGFSSSKLKFHPIAY